MAFDRDGDFPAYVSVADRRAAAAKHVAKLRKKGVQTSPIERMTGKKIATTFWGEGWCKNLEAYDSLSARIARGRTYVRNGSVIDLQITKGTVRSLVSGSEIYEVEINIHSLKADHWKGLVKECAGKIESVVELLTGKISAGVMEILCRKATGIFPGPKQIEMVCSCPDGSWLCKHLAATLYGVGARLDHQPELLFVLRGVETTDLFAHGTTATLGAGTSVHTLQNDGLADLFGIEMDSETLAEPTTIIPVKAKAKQSMAKPQRKTGKTGRRSKSNP